MTTKRCSACGKKYPATTEYFHRQRDNKDGLVYRCKQCVALYGKEWRRRNPDKLHENYRRWRERHPGLATERVRQWKERNRDRYREASKRYYLRNKETIAHKTRERFKKNYARYHRKSLEWSRKNHEKMLEISRRASARYKRKHPNKARQWQQDNRELVRQYCHQYRARKRNLPAILTQEQWRCCKRYFNNACAYCGRPLKRLCQDHFIPMSKGGVYAMSNIVPACRSCNSSKRDRDFFEWYPCQPFYSRVRERKILKCLGFTRDRKRQLALVI